MSITRKYRGKRKDNGEWVEGYLLEQNTPEYHCYIVISFKAEQDNRHTEILECDIYEVIPETVGQYTDLTDKSGTKIFEGDIVKFIHKGKIKSSDDYPFAVQYGEPYSRNYKIKYVNTFTNYGLRFINGSIHFPCKQSTLSMYDCEIIGNLHDNPELLKGGAEK